MSSPTSDSPPAVAPAPVPGTSEPGTSTPAAGAEFARLVAQVERRYAARPGALRRRVCLLVLTGYGLFFLILAGMALLAAWLVWLALAVPTVAGLWPFLPAALIVAALMGQLVLFLGNPFQTPQGRELTATDCPRLFARLEELRSRGGVQPFDKVWLIGDYNAGVATEPRWGLLGPSRRHLLIGLPLLVLLTPDQMAAVLAHEVAHYSTADDWFLVWIHRLQQRWTRIFADWSAGRSPWLNLCGWPLRASVRRFWPRFNAHAAVLARTEEFRADRRSADWTSPAAAASALWCIDCYAMRLREETWPAIWRETATRPEPPDDLFQSLPRRLAESPAADDAHRWIARLQTGTVDVDSTHPSLVARLERLGVPIPTGEFPLAPAWSAADDWLAPHDASLRGEFSREWQTGQARTWNILHLRTRQVEQSLAAANQPAASPVSPLLATAVATAAEWNTLKELIDLRGRRACELPLREFLDRHPGHPRATLAWGALLFDRDDPAGETFLRQLWPDGAETLAIDAYTQLVTWHRTQNHTAEVRALEQEFERVTQNWHAARLERTKITAADPFLPAKLPPQDQARLVEILAREPGWDRAWLAEKQMQHRPADRLFVLAISLRRRSFLEIGRRERALALCSRLARQLELPGQLLVVADVGRYHAVAKKLRQQGGLELPPAHVAAPVAAPESPRQP